MVKLEPLTPTENVIRNMNSLMTWRSLGHQSVADAMETLGTLSKTAESHAVRVQASRAIINALTTASGEMTENEAGKKLLEAVRDADHASKIKTPIPDEIKDAWDDA